LTLQFLAGADLEGAKIDTDLRRDIERLRTKME
jgi:hypothetical protein